MTEETAFPLLGDAPDPGPDRGVLALLSDAEGRLLMHLRDDRAGVTHPGLWSFFGGGVEAGESLLQAMVRELAEELGIDVARGALKPFAWLQSDSPRRTRLFLFTATLALDPAEIRLGEGAGFGFFTEGQARALTIPSVLKPALTTYFSTR